MRDKKYMLYLYIYLFIYGIFNVSVSRPISGAQVYDVPATHICTELGFIIVTGAVVIQVFSLSHFFIPSHFQAGLRLSDTTVSSYRQTAN
jgi:hypothetical protein